MSTGFLDVTPLLDSPTNFPNFMKPQGFYMFEAAPHY